jgi:Lauroyl/myristoyl acyltransferase
MAAEPALGGDLPEAQQWIPGSTCAAIPKGSGVLTIDRTEGLHRGVTVLRNGGMLGVLIDQHAGDKGVWTPFFGRLASTTPFPAVLAKKTGAALMPVSIVTSGIARWRVEVDDFIPSREASTAEITARII